MKTKIMVTLVAAAVTLSATQASAEEISLSRRGPESPNVLLINPGDLINGVVSLEYERALTSFFGVVVGLSVTAFRGAFTPVNEASFTAMGPELGARFHFIKNAPGGLWLGPSIQGVYIAARSNGAVTRAFGYGLAASIGYNFILGRHFVLQLGVGGGFTDYGDGLAWAPRFKLGLGGTF